MIEFKKNVSLAEHTTFKIGGQAKFFVNVYNSKQIIEAVKKANEEKINYIILAGGSNILVSDTGFDGLVIKISSNNFKIENNTITAEAGVNFNRLVNSSAEAGLSGLEWMIGIYGTIGGAVRGNAGAYGHSISNVVEEVEIFNDNKIIKLKNKDCKFSYRDSIFKQTGGVIVSVKLKLKKGDKNRIQDILKETMTKRTQRIPIEPNPGSIFKNIPSQEIDKVKMMKGLDISDAEFKHLMKLGDFPAGYIVEHLGFKGKIIGGAQVSKKHCNFIINKNNAKAADIVMLISMIKQKARSKVGIQLHEEVQMVGF